MVSKDIITRLKETLKDSKISHATRFKRVRSYLYGDNIDSSSLYLFKAEFSLFDFDSMGYCWPLFSPLGIEGMKILGPVNFFV